MLTVICGEDSVSSRNYFIAVKKEYQHNGWNTTEIAPGQIEDIEKWLGESLSLFGQKRIFFTEGLNRQFKRQNSKILSSINRLVARKDITLFDWEEGISSRELKITKGVKIKEFKPPTSIFKLLDACYPSNFKNFVNLLHQLPEKVEDVFIFIMLAKYLRNLLLVKFNNLNTNLQTWQLAKLKSQAKFWPSDKLLNFYEGLYRIDLAVKTSKNPFNIRQSLDILASYFL